MEKPLISRREVGLFALLGLAVAGGFGWNAIGEYQRDKREMKTQDQIRKLEMQLYISNQELLRLKNMINPYKNKSPLLETNNYKETEISDLEKL